MTTTWRASAPETIDADLAALWRDASQTGPVARALMSNLVIVSPERAFAGVEDLARRHPSRTILLSYTSGAAGKAAPEAVRVGLLTFGEGEARYGLEIIAVHTDCAEVSLPSIVGRLTVGSVPTTVWWTADLSEPAPPEAIAMLGRQLIYNSARWRDVKKGVSIAATLLGQPQPPDLVDLNWRRIAPLRNALVHEACREAKGHAVRAARVAYARGEAPAAWLLAGWLAARTGARASLNEDDGEERLTVTIEGDGWSIAACMNEHRVQVQSDRPPFVTAVRAEGEADAVASELVSLIPDAGLRDALLALSAS